MRTVRGPWRGLACAVACLGVLAGSNDGGVTAQASFGCALDGSSVMAFGAYDPMSNAHLDAQGQISYRCYNNAGGGGGAAGPAGQGHGHAYGRGSTSSYAAIVVQITLSQGNAGTFARAMIGARDQLRYNVYTDSQRVLIWGDGTGGTHVYQANAQPDNHVETIPVFGRVFGAQDVGASQYGDNLVVTLHF